MATYNLMIQPTAVGSAVGYAKTGSLFDLFQKDVFDCLISQLSISDLRSLVLSCKSFYQRISQLQMIEQVIRPYQKQLTSLLIKLGIPTLGFMLQHRYSFDGEKQIDLTQLRRRDYFFCKALENVFQNSIKTRKCTLLEEYTDDQDDNEEDSQSVRFRIASALFEDLQGLNTDDVPPAIAAELGTSKLTEEDISLFKGTYTDMDEDSGIVAIPFRGVMWLCSKVYLERCCAPRRGADVLGVATGLWGNESTFSMYWYEDVVVLVDVRGEKKEGITEELPWSSDIRC